MTQGNEIFDFTYHMAHHEGKGSVEFIPKPKKRSELDTWTITLLQAICQQIAKQEPAYIVEALPFSDKVDRSKEPDHFAFLHIEIDKVPELSYNPDHYVVKTRKQP